MNRRRSWTTGSLLWYTRRYTLRAAKLTPCSVDRDRWRNGKTPAQAPGHSWPRQGRNGGRRPDPTCDRARRGRAVSARQSVLGSAASPGPVARALQRRAARAPTGRAIRTVGRWHVQVAVARGAEHQRLQADRRGPGYPHWTRPQTEGRLRLLTRHGLSTILASFSGYTAAMPHLFGTAVVGGAPRDT